MDQQGVGQPDAGRPRMGRLAQDGWHEGGGRGQPVRGGAAWGRVEGSIRLAHGDRRGVTSVGRRHGVSGAGAIGVGSWGGGQCAHNMGERSARVVPAGGGLSSVRSGAGGWLGRAVCTGGLGRRRTRARGGGGGGVGQTMRMRVDWWVACTCLLQGDQRRVEGVGQSAQGGRGSSVCGGGGDDGWIPTSTFLEKSLEREFTPFFLLMTAIVCGGGPFPSYRAQDGQRGERAHLRPRLQSLTES